MKKASPYLLLLLFSLPISSSYAAGMFEYSLFNSKLNVALPHEPQRVETGISWVEMYTAADKSNSIVYTVRSTPTDLKHNIGAYKTNFKETLDQLLTESARIDNQTLVSFTSKFERRADKYFAEMTTWYYQDGVKRFRSVKRIIHKKKIYDWTVMYYDLPESTGIFDGYKTYMKIN